MNGSVHEYGRGFPASAEGARGAQRLDEEDDFELIRRVAAKDRKAFETLYYRYSPRLGRYLSRLLKQCELVEEALNDTLLVVWQNAARFDPSGRLLPWLYGIAHYKALKALARLSKRQSELPLDYDDADADERNDHPRDPDNPEQALLRQDLGRVLAQAIETLSPEHRAVVELAFCEGFSYQEIATITECPVNTVKTRMFHARRRLTHALARLGLGSNGPKEAL